MNRLEYIVLIEPATKHVIVSWFKQSFEHVRVNVEEGIEQRDKRFYWGRLFFRNYIMLVGGEEGWLWAGLEIKPVDLSVFLWDFDWFVGELFINVNFLLFLGVGCIVSLFLICFVNHLTSTFMKIFDVFKAFMVFNWFFAWILHLSCCNQRIFLLIYQHPIKSNKVFVVLFIQKIEYFRSLEAALLNF